MGVAPQGVPGSQDLPSRRRPLASDERGTLEAWGGIR